jgi:AMMECR1 domain-containing protein
VGTLSPRWPTVAEETWHMARDAAFRDGRFAAVTPSELVDLSFEVSVIAPPERTAALSELNPAHYGVIVATTDGRRGTLLPGIEMVETVEKQLEIARRKAGIGDGEPVEIERFTVRKFCEPDARNEVAP